MSETLRNSNDKPELALALAGGGSYAIAVQMAIIETLQEEYGIEVQNAEILGTSGGSVSGGLIVSGKTYEDVENIPQISFPNYKPGYMKGVMNEVFGDEYAFNLRAMAFEVPHMRAAKLRDHSIADKAAASSTIPGLFLPHHIDGKLYVDGGVRSITSADVAPRAHNLITISAFARHFKPPVGNLRIPAGQFLEHRLNRQMKTWQRKHNGKAVHIYPDAEVSDMVKGANDVLDFELAKDVYWKMKEEGCESLRKNEVFLRELASTSMYAIS